MRWFHRFELQHLLARAGFTQLTFYRSFAREPWTAGGETTVWRGSAADLTQRKKYTIDAEPSGFAPTI